MNNLETFLSNCCQVALWIKNQRKIIFFPIHTRGQVRQRGTVTTLFLPLWSLMRISSREPQREQLCMEYNHCTGLSGCWCTFSTSKTMAYETCYFYIISFPPSPSLPLPFLCMCLFQYTSYTAFFSTSVVSLWDVYTVFVGCYLSITSLVISDFISH